jgi:hypothetical protein
MRLKVSRLKEMIHDEIVRVALEEQKSSSSSGSVTTYAGEFGVPDPGSKSLADQDITTAMSQEDQSLVQGLDEDDDEDPTDPAEQEKRKNVAATKVRQERERAAAVGLVSVPSG